MTELLRSLNARYGAARAGLKGIVVGMLLGSPAIAEPVTVAALGDSLTQGFGLVQDQGLVPQLERWLIAQGEDVKVLNAGVSGDTTAGGLARLAWTLTPDVDALIVALGANDLLRGIDPAVSRANLDGILSQAQASDLPVMLIGLPAPGNYGPTYQMEFDAIYPDLAATYDAILEPHFLRPIAESDAPAALMQADGLHPNPDGVALIVDHIGPKVRTLIDRVE